MCYFKEWTLIICLSVVAISILEMITINEKMNRTISLVLGAFLLLSILIPIKNFKSDNLFGEKLPSETFIKDNLSSFISEQGFSLSNNSIKSLIKNALEEKNISVKKIKIYMDTKKDNCISIIKAEIYVDRSFFDRKEEIKNIIAKKFEINKDIIILGSE